MSALDWTFHILGSIVVGSPIALVGLLGLTTIIGHPLREQTLSRLTQSLVLLTLIPAIIILILMLIVGTRYVPVEWGNWMTLDEASFHFHWKFVFDRLSIPFLLLSCVLCGVVGVFTRRYLHREEGYQRFFLLYSFFFCGMVLSSLGGTIETLFVGWELVGLSSALLVAYFHERPNPVRNGQRVWAIYRLSDAAFLIAAIAMHHLTGEGDFGGLMVSGVWPDGTAAITSQQALGVGILLLIAAAGKSALPPLSGWLPRAMEGPTPSSAIFYGALSVHLGVYLLLRVSPLIEASLILQGLVISLGIVSAFSGAVMSRVQSDIKVSLAYASLTQVGIIVVEIGLGFRYLALIHIVGHACLRTMQLLRAPTLLRDYDAMENALGRSLGHGTMNSKWLTPAMKSWLYRVGFERGYMDASLDRFFVVPFASMFRNFDRWERAVTDWISKEQSRESDTTELHPENGAVFHSLSPLRATRAAGIATAKPDRGDSKPATPEDYTMADVDSPQKLPQSVQESRES